VLAEGGRGGRAGELMTAARDPPGVIGSGGSGSEGGPVGGMLASEADDLGLKVPLRLEPNDSLLGTCVGLLVYAFSVDPGPRRLNASEVFSCKCKAVGGLLRCFPGDGDLVAVLLAKPFPALNALDEESAGESMVLLKGDPSEC
jgi:hypothetical protein